MTTNADSRHRAKSAKLINRSTSTGRYVSSSEGKHPRAGVTERIAPGAAGAVGEAAATSETMPQAAVRTGFLIETLGSGAELARLLGVNRSQPSQWRSGKEKPSPRIAQQLLDLDYVMAKALQIWPAKAALQWFHGSNDYLDGARPIDVLKLRGATEVIKALDVEMA